MKIYTFDVLIGGICYSIINHRKYKKLYNRYNNSRPIKFYTNISVNRLRKSVIMKASLVGTRNVY